MLEKVDIRPGQSGYIAKNADYGASGNCNFSVSDPASSGIYKCTVKAMHPGNHAFHDAAGTMKAIFRISGPATPASCRYCHGSGKVALLLSTVPCDCLTLKK